MLVQLHQPITSGISPVDVAEVISVAIVLQLGIIKF